MSKDKSVRIIPCISVQFEGAKDGSIVSDFMRFCLDEGMHGINNTGGLSGPGVYYHAHLPEHKNRIIEWFKKQGIKVEEYE